MLITDLDIEDYHSRGEVSKSQLDTLDLSPAIFFARHRDPNRPAPVAKSGQLEGNLAHCAVLEPETFEQRYVVGKALNRNTKEWKEFVAAHPDRVAIQPDQYEAATRQAVSVRALPEIGEALQNGKPEVSAFWTDEETGVPCRCRPDFVHPFDDKSVALLDLKTYTDASPREFARQVARKNYAKQAAFYSDGYEAASGMIVRAFIFIAVSTEYPYAASAVMLDDDSLESGRQHYKRNLRTYAECERTGKWPGYDEGITLIRLPQWAMETEE